MKPRRREKKDNGDHMFETNATLIAIVESWKEKENTAHTISDILDWIEQKNKNLKVEISHIPFSEDAEWKYVMEEGGIVNSKRTFFKIMGLTQREENDYYEQPIIIQNEIGYLGIICKKINGVLHFLMQAKIEPGNINKIQISPTIQATKSNFMRAHGGNVPAYLEYFTDTKKYEVVVDQIQSEQASRFYGKRNRNIIIRVEEDIEVLPSHMWMTLGQIKELMKIDNLVNMDTRTVISCIPFALRDYQYKELMYMQSLFNNQAFFNSVFSSSNSAKLNRLYQFMNEYKMLNKKKIELVDLHSLKEWRITDGREYIAPKCEFKVIYCDISIEGREVRRWQQPLFAACGESIFGLIYRIKNNKMEFLVQSVSEVGCFDGIEIGPSVQIGPNQVENPESSIDSFFLQRFNAKEGVKFSGLFSEEGGRFYHEQNRNVLMQVGENELEEVPQGYFWVDFHTLNIMIQFNNCLNIQLRNLLSILDF